MGCAGNNRKTECAGYNKKKYPMYNIKKKCVAYTQKEYTGYNTLIVLGITQNGDVLGIHKKLLCITRKGVCCV